MKIQPVIKDFNIQNFGTSLKLNDSLINKLENSTGLTIDEITRLPFTEKSRLKKELNLKNGLNNQNLYIVKKYKKIRENLRLLKPEYYVYIR